MKIEIDTKNFIKANYSVNALGEILRAIFFDQSKGFGCYGSFDLNEGIETLEPITTKEDEDTDSITYTCARWNGIVMRYYWDGDGYLEFNLNLGDDGKIFNDDCKKDYGWKYVSKNKVECWKRWHELMKK